MRVLVTSLLTAACLTVSGCQLVYKLPTRQGNVIDQKELDKLKLGMTREQVQFVLGTPVAANPFRSDRWDYLGYYKSPRGDTSSRTVSLYFDGEQLTRMEGVTLASKDAAAQAKPDAETVIRQDARDRRDAARDDAASRIEGQRLQTENATP